MTQTQQAINDGQFGIKGHTDGPIKVPVQTRSERPKSYSPDDFAIPTNREVNWKYSPLARLAPVFQNLPNDDNPGDPSVTYSVTAPSGVTVDKLAIGQAPRGEGFVPEDLPAAIAWQQTAESLHLFVTDEQEVTEPTFVDITGAGANRRANGHIVLEAGKHSRSTVVLKHQGSALYAENVEIILRDGAEMTVVAIQEWSDEAVHASSHQARVGRDAKLKHISVTIGSGVTRLNPSAWLAEPGAEAELYGLYFSTSGQHIEHQVYVNHDAPQTVSNVNYKGALQGESARSVWIGDVLIGRKATGTDSYEQNRNLILSDGARADSVPNLEIETGDIEGAGHASATGRFSEEHMFYLQARGIPEKDARRLVVRGFLAEIIQKIHIPSVAEPLTEALETKLAASETA